MRVTERRIRRLEAIRQRRRELGPGPAEIIRERRRKQLRAEGKEPEPALPPTPLVDKRGRPLSIAEIILARRRQRRALAEKALQSSSCMTEGGGAGSNTAPGVTGTPGEETT